LWRVRAKYTITSLVPRFVTEEGFGGSGRAGSARYARTSPLRRHTTPTTHTPPPNPQPNPPPPHPHPPPQPTKNPPPPTTPPPPPPPHTPPPTPVLFRGTRLTGRKASCPLCSAVRRAVKTQSFHKPHYHRPPTPSREPDSRHIADIPLIRRTGLERLIEMRVSPRRSANM